MWKNVCENAAFNYHNWIKSHITVERTLQVLQSWQTSKIDFYKLKKNEVQSRVVNKGIKEFWDDNNVVFLCKITLQFKTGHVPFFNVCWLPDYNLEYYDELILISMLLKSWAYTKYCIHLPSYWAK